MKKFLMTFAVGAFVASTAMADYTDHPPAYVDLKPLNELITSSPKSCSVQSTLQMPMIDWAGDFVTTYANGGVDTDPNGMLALMDVSAHLYVQNDLVQQAKDYLNCDTPFLRVTQGQAMMLAPIMETNDATKMVAFYKHSFSQGDHLVSKSSLSSPEDLCKANIAIMRYGPHTDFLGRILTDAGCDISTMQSTGQIKWTENLTGENSPYHALVSDSTIDAAFVVTPDMIDLVDNGHVPGSKVLVSTKTLNRVISDVYLVRKDYFLANKEQIKNLTHALFLAGEEFEGIMSGLGQSLSGDNPSLNADQQMVLSMVASVFPNSTKGGDAVEAGFFWLDVDFSGYPENVKWATENNPRGWLGVNNEVQSSLASLGLSDRAYTLGHAAWDYTSMTEGLENTSGVEQPTFNASAVAALVSERQKTGTLDTGELYSFEIFFGPDQNTFPADRYADDFKQLIDFAQAYGGAIITVEGHSDPLGFLMAQNPSRFGKSEKPATRLALRKQGQALRNLSATRATAARDALMEYAGDIVHVNMDPSQFTIVAQGIDDPKTGVCDTNLPCAPKTEAEWKSNMRVVFRIIAVPTESNVFVAAQE